ncbi:MAG: RidA family protein [Acidimicrobiales bacterium]|nr:RidA family protein [Acidimicrobiales bacterium]MDG1878119.1 RidA family protein [Acidimicrobiales bacterium]
MQRTSIEIASLSHLAPLPAASKVGPLLESSITTPFNPGTRNLPPTFAEQAENLFIHMEQMLEAAGGGWEHVAKITFFLAEPESRAKLNVPWLERFPNEASRPARHIMEVDAGTSKVTCIFTAYIA